MTRKVYIGDTGGDVDRCMSDIKRTSEDRIHFQIINKDDLLEHGLSAVAQNNLLMYFVPYLNSYQGLALYVESSFSPKFDVDLFFNHKVMKEISSPVIYFLRHNVWLFDCNDPTLKTLNPVTLNNTDILTIERNLTVIVVEDI
jgi:hypothetical protein